jgi:cytidylate kinase
MDSPEARWILAQLRRRDQLDSNRDVAPLRPAEDAIHIVTDGNRFEDTVRAVVQEIRRAEAARSVAAAGAGKPAR